MVRLVTYNVHRCVGTDRRLDVGRVAEVIAAQSPDIVALQELDVGRARTGGIDQAHRLAQRLGMAFHFNAAFTVEEEQFGDAILTTLPERLVKAGPLPGHPRFPQLEPRGAIWVEIETPAGVLSVINTHLGLVPREQRIQAAALVGEDWALGAAAGAPLVLVGDMNATPRNAAYRILAARLAEARARRAVLAPRPDLPLDLPGARHRPCVRQRYGDRRRGAHAPRPAHAAGLRPSAAGGGPQPGGANACLTARASASDRSRRRNGRSEFETSVGSPMWNSAMNSPTGPSRLGSSGRRRRPSSSAQRPSASPPLRR